MSEYEKISTVNSSERLDVIFTIVPKGKGEQVIDLLRDNDVMVNMTCLGRGTAPSSILEMLGIGATDKDVVLSFVKNKTSSSLLRRIAKKLDFSKPGNGISFTVPLKSVAGIMAFKFLTTDYSEEV